MNRRRFALLALAWLAVAGLVGYETRIVNQRAAHIRAMAQQVAQQSTEAAGLRRDGDAATRELAAATRQLAELPSERETKPALSPARQQEVDRWLERLRNIRSAFEEKPDRRIPEMGYLTDEDWLRVTKSASVDTDDGLRRALAEVRSTAIQKFLKELGTAMRRYAFDHPGTKPTNLQEIAALFDRPADPAIFARYELTDQISRSFSGIKPGAWAVQNKAPIDEDFDSRFQVHIDGQNSGQSGGAGLAAWRPDLDDRLRRAYRAYATANQGDSPKDIAAVVPYFDPPLDSALAERLVRSMKK